MLLTQPYDSQSLKDLDRNKLTFLVNRYIINDYVHILNNKNLIKNEFKKANTVLKPVTLYGFTSGENEIPPLEFPLVNFEKNWILFDMRKHYLKAKQVSEIKPKMNFDTDVVNLRNKLTGLWAVGYVKEFQLMEASRQVFGEWISRLLVNFRGLDLANKYVIQILCEIYYLRLFSNPDNRNQSEYSILLRGFSRRGIPKDILDMIYDKTLEMDTLEDLCNNIGELVESGRLKGFGVGLLFDVIKSSWIGLDQQNFLALSLEYPPFFTTMVYTSLISAGHKRTRIGDSANELPKQMKDVFVQQVNSFIKTHLGE